MREQRVTGMLHASHGGDETQLRQARYVHMHEMHKRRKGISVTADYTPGGSLGAYVRRRREELGLTQEELAERIGEGARQSDISRLEREKVMLPRRRRLERMAEALGVSLGTLFREAGWLEGDDQSASNPPDLHDEAVLMPDLDDEGEAGALVFEEHERLHETLMRAAEVHDRTNRVIQEARAAVAKARRTRRGGAE